MSYGGHVYAWHLFEPRHPEAGNQTAAPSGARPPPPNGAAAPATPATTPTTTRRFLRNQRVYVTVRSQRDTGAGTIEATPEDIARAGGVEADCWGAGGGGGGGGGEEPRYRIAFDERDEQTGQPKRAHVRAGRLTAVLRPPPPHALRRPQAVVTHDTLEFRRQARAQLSCGGRDLRVLEVGASTGECSAAIVQHLGGYASCSGSSSPEEEEEDDEDGTLRKKRRHRRRVWQRGLVGVDLAASALEDARRRAPQAKFVLCDVLADPEAVLAQVLGRRRRRKLGVEEEAKEQRQDEGGGGGGDGEAAAVSALFLDIGGKRAVSDVLAAVDVLARALRPELIVVKSEELAASARAWREARGRMGGGGEDEEWCGEGAPAEAVPESERWWLEAKETAAAAAVELGEAPAAPAIEVPPWYARLVVRRRQRQQRRPTAPGEEKQEEKEGCGWAGGVRPQKLPLRFVETDDGQRRPICRFHNYGECRRRRGEGAAAASSSSPSSCCPYDHDHCHACLEQGHRAADWGDCPVARAAAAVGGEGA